MTHVVYSMLYTVCTYIAYSYRYVQVQSVLTPTFPRNSRHSYVYLSIIVMIMTYDLLRIHLDMI